MMADSKKEDIIRRCQGMRMTVDAGYNLKGMCLTGNLCKGMFNSLGQIILDAEEMQKTIEEQEERIAIMSEGKFQELFLEVLEKYKDAEVSNIWEHSGCITHDEKELEKVIAEYKRKAGIRVDDSEEGE